MSAWYDITAEDILKTWSLQELTDIFRDYGDERFAYKIAKEIIYTRKKESIKTTFQLTEVIKKAIPPKFSRGKIHPATRVFQALRI